MSVSELFIDRGTRPRLSQHTYLNSSTNCDVRRSLTRRNCNSNLVGGYTDAGSFQRAIDFGVGVVRFDVGFGVAEGRERREDDDGVGESHIGVGPAGGCEKWRIGQKMMRWRRVEQ